jgi:N-acyl-D-amino-acid deacylase
MGLDLAIIGGIVVDGSGRKGYETDLGVKDGRIAEIGSIQAGDADAVIDASGLIVAPGFIDIHSHSDAPLLVNPRAESMVRQGVTTGVIGNCGGSIAPLRELARKEIEGRLELLGVDAPWSSFGDYLKRLGQGVALNVAAFVGHGTVRQCVMDLEERAPTSGELEEMKGLVGDAGRGLRDVLGARLSAWAVRGHD